MNTKKTYEYIIKKLKDKNPKLYQTITYLKPYYLFHKIKLQEEQVIKTINARYPFNTSFAQYDLMYHRATPKATEFVKRRDYYIAKGKHVLDLIFKENLQFVSEYKVFLDKLHSMPKTEDDKKLQEYYDGIMVQVVYRCIECNASYWGDMKYAANIYSFLIDQAQEEIKKYKLKEKNASTNKKINPID